MTLSFFFFFNGRSYIMEKIKVSHTEFHITYEHRQDPQKLIKRTDSSRPRGQQNKSLQALLAQIPQRPCQCHTVSSCDQHTSSSKHDIEGTWTRKSRTPRIVSLSSPAYCYRLKRIVIYFSPAY